MDYQRIYNSIITRARDRQPPEIKERHHIIPKSMGGSDERSNLVDLTLKEHYVCHLLLTKIHPKDNKVHYAIHRMNNSGKHHTGAMYAFTRLKHIEMLKIVQKGRYAGHTTALDTETGEFVHITKELFDSSDRYRGVNFGRKLPNTSTGHSLYRTTEGNIIRLPTNHHMVLSGEVVGVNKGKDLTKVMEAAREKTLSRPWYEKCEPEVVIHVFALHDWFQTKYDPTRPKATGVKKFIDAYDIPKSKTYKHRLKSFADGYNPYEDEGLLIYVETNKLKRR